MHLLFVVIRRLAKPREIDSCHHFFVGRLSYHVAMVSGIFARLARAHRISNVALARAAERLKRTWKRASDNRRIGESKMFGIE